MLYSFIKRFSFTKNNKEYYVITFLFNNSQIINAYVDEFTFDWFESLVCGDEIPSDFINVGLGYNGKAVVHIKIK